MGKFYMFIPNDKKGCYFAVLDIIDVLNSFSRKYELSEDGKYTILL